MRGGDTNSELISLEDKRSNVLNRLLDGGDHYDDFPSSQRQHLERMFNRNLSQPHPRETLMNKLAIQGIASRPQTMGSLSTNN